MGKCFPSARETGDALHLDTLREERRPEKLMGPQNDVFAPHTHAVLKDLPYLYLDCGSDNMFLAVNRKFVGA